jgi:hypothetical protein
VRLLRESRIPTLVEAAQETFIQQLLLKLDDIIETWVSKEMDPLI